MEQEELLAWDAWRITARKKIGSRQYFIFTLKRHIVAKQNLTHAFLLIFIQKSWCCAHRQSLFHYVMYECFSA